MTRVDVAVVGAGPFGLSVAACLDEAGVDYRLFGRPMASWAEAMPEDMFLKSDGFASNLIIPRANSELGDFCREIGVPYHRTATRVTRDEFVRYGQSFRQRFVSNWAASDVKWIERTDDGFAVTALDGQVCLARAVVLAVGITHFGAIPSGLAALPPALLSHSYGHRRMESFAGRDVTVVGAGSSAVELAAFLARDGAKTRLLARGDHVKFNTGPLGAERPLGQRLRHPGSGLGPGVRSWLCCRFPGVYRRLPADWRVRILHRHLGAKTPFEYRKTVDDKVEVVTGVTVESAREQDGRAHLTCRRADGSVVEFVTDHVIAGTGYRPDCTRLPFLSGDIAKAIVAEQGYPILSADFETSVPGLFVTGLASAGSFGPLMRFVYGAEYTVSRVTPALKRRFARMAAE